MKIYKLYTCLDITEPFEMRFLSIFLPLVTVLFDKWFGSSVGVSGLTEPVKTQPVSCLKVGM